VLGPYVGISEPLDDRVIGEAYDRPYVCHIPRQVFDFTIRAIPSRAINFYNCLAFSIQ
jgi:hypothetical protein